MLYRIVRNQHDEIRWGAFAFLAVLTIMITLVVLGVRSVEERRAPPVAPPAPVEPSEFPKFTELEAGPERKAAFFSYLRPIIAAENSRIEADRRRLEEIAARAATEGLSRADKIWVRELAVYYRLLDEELGNTIDSEQALADREAEQALLGELRRRVDRVPSSLALAQAAKESGWGTSRFARQGYNLFGQRCFRRGCGIVPKARSPGLTHEVRRYDSAAASVASYMRNINTHPEYERLRRERAKLRRANERLSGISLADHLESYSERREEYIDEIKQLIRHNRLEPQV